MPRRVEPTAARTRGPTRPYIVPEQESRKISVTFTCDEQGDEFATLHLIPGIWTKVTHGDQSKYVFSVVNHPVKDRNTRELRGYFPTWLDCQTMIDDQLCQIRASITLEAIPLHDQTGHSFETERKDAPPEKETQPSPKGSSDRL